MTSHTRNNTYQPHSTAHSGPLAGTPLASFKRRALALWIDMLVAGVSFAAISIGGILATDKLGLVHETKQTDLKFNFFGNWYSIVWLVIYFTP